MTCSGIKQFMQTELSHRNTVIFYRAVAMFAEDAEFASVGCGRARFAVHKLINRPTSSICARIAMVASILAILVSFAIMLVGTLPQYRECAPIVTTGDSSNNDDRNTAAVGGSASGSPNRALPQF